MHYRQIRVYYNMRRRPAVVNKYITPKGLLILYVLLITNAIVIFINSKDYSSKYDLEFRRRKETSLQQGKEEVCQDIFHIQDSYLKNLSNEKVKFFTKLSYGSTKDGFVWYHLYYLLSTLLPSLIIKNKNPGASGYVIEKESRLDRMQWKLPYLPCQLRKYTGNDIRTCIHKRGMKGKQFRITFIGDSRVRRPMEFLLELLHQYNLTIAIKDGTTLTLDQFFGDKGTILWPKYKQRVSVRSPVLNNFLINYTWAPFWSRGDSEVDQVPYLKYQNEEVFSSPNIKSQSSSPINEEKDDYYINIIKQNDTRSAAVRYKMQAGRANGAYDEIVRLLRQPASLLPDFVIIDAGAWLLPEKELTGILENLDKWAITGSLKLQGILRQLASRTTVIILLPTPFKDSFRFSQDEYSYFNFQSNPNQQWYLNAQIQMLPRNIIKWDSFIPVGFSSNDDCYKIFQNKIALSSLPKIQRFDQDNSYGCSSKVHSGYEAIGIAVQMLLNHICNEDMDKQESNHYCCER